ncbi:Glycine-rich protein [Capsicum annuum]|uniref:glycine-rich protein DC9.1 isoform X1 n=1 Tax=Capsicum annuum TaxID=4072 RepID=UPI001FB1325A|nr:glycine-rich protein DC9.1 isoform X1 [Capsicum annuum]KAF3669421.1 Glycine-rich protein [Capsicum annuum]KAF3674782.1 Glycine-rich protein [Capsicum annuum]
MGSKTFLLLGLFLAIFLMISSEVVARELSETPNTEKEVDVDHYYGGGGYKKGGYHKGGCYHKCKYHKCCTYEEYMALGIATESETPNLTETPNSEKEVDVDHYYGGGGYKKGGYHKGCYHKCKYHKCCTYEEYMALGIATESDTPKLTETPNSEKEVDVDHYYGGGGYKKGGYHKGGCYHKCKYHKCCTYEEYMALGIATESEPQN